MRPNFDTQLLARTLVKHGLNNDAADAIVDAMREAQIDLVTKEDLNTAVLKIESKLDAQISKLEMQITKLDGKLDAQITKLDGKLDTQVSRLETQIAQAMHRQTIWLLGGMAGLLALAGAIQHFFK